MGFSNVAVSRRSFKGEGGLLYQKVSTLVLFVLFLAVLLAPMFDAAFGGMFSYADEVAAVLIGVWGLLGHPKGCLSVGERTAGWLLSIVVFIGFWGNIVYGYQQSYFAVLVDAFTCIKLFVVYFALRRVVDGETASFLMRMFCGVGKVFAVVASMCFALHATHVLTLGSGREVFGINCYQFFYSHPTNLAAYCVGFLALFCVQAKKNRKWILCFLILLLTTQRAKAAGFVFIAVLLLLAFGERKTVPPFLLAMLGCAGALVVGYDAIQSYYFEDSSVRALLMNGSFDLARDVFPFGSGFGTFATYMSGLYYSPLYFQMGMSGIWGLSPDHFQFTSDTFWPAVLGQFGFIGVFLFVIALFLIGREIVRQGRKGAFSLAPVLMIPIYLLVLSTSDAAFFNFYGPFFGLIETVVLAAGVHQGIEARDAE